jgi:hypothetical protein
LTYNENRECLGCGLRDEKQIATYILSFQIANQLLKRFDGEWNITSNEIVLKLNNAENPITVEFTSGTINYKTLSTKFYPRYSAEEGVNGLVDGLCTDLALPTIAKAHKNSDFLFNLFVKLVEIFHARCDLRIAPGKTQGEWEIRLSEDGPFGWIGEDQIAENRFGEKMDIAQWENLRPEKVATYVFGFNRFCKNFQCPMK